MTVIEAADADAEQLTALTASSFEGAGAVKLECSDDRLIEVTDADWTGMMNIGVAQSSDVQSSHTTPTSYNNSTDQRTFMLVKQRCDGQLFQYFHLL